MKTFRRIDTGVNPELELGSFLTRQRFGAVPAVAGDLEYRLPVDPGARAGAATGGGRRHRGPARLRAERGRRVHATRCVRSGRFFDAVIGCGDDPRAVESLAATGPGWTLLDAEPPELLDELASEYLDAAELLGRRTGGAPRDARVGPGRSRRSRPSRSTRSTSGACTSRCATRPGAPSARCGGPGSTPPTPRRRRRGHGSEEHTARHRAARDGRHHRDAHPDPRRPPPRARCSSPGATSRSSTSRASRPGRSRSDASSARHCATSRACCGRSTTPPAVRSASSSNAGRSSPSRSRASASATGPRHGSAGCRRRTCAATSRPCASGRRGSCPRPRAEIDACLGAHVLDKAMYELQYELAHRPAWVSVPLSGILDIAAAA